jgi:hypothetical protein
MKRFSIKESVMAVVALSIMGLFSIMLPGCKGMLPGSGLEQSLANSAETLNKKIQDEGILNEFMLDIDGHVQDPGLESYVSATFAAGVRMKGVNGNVVARGHGDSTRLPPGMRDVLIKQLDGPVSDEQRAAILIMLGWNRTPEGGNPVGALGR